MENTQTISNGVALINNEASDQVSLVQLQIKELGLSVILLGLAEHAAKRVEKLSKVITKLEDDLFNENMITRLSDQEKIERYNLAVAAVNSSANYIKQTTGNIDWNSLEIRLRQLTMASGTGDAAKENSPSSDSQLRQVADQLLKELGRESAKS